tara:strand:+ start:248 stop:904 length:657 start_codon:yes stop_codon:yes gene_type:complete
MFKRWLLFALICIGLNACGGKKTPSKQGNPPAEARFSDSQIKVLSETTVEGFVQVLPPRIDKDLGVTIRYESKRPNENGVSLEVAILAGNCPIPCQPISNTSHWEKVFESRFGSRYRQDPQGVFEMESIEASGAPVVRLYGRSYQEKETDNGGKSRIYIHRLELHHADEKKQFQLAVTHKFGSVSVRTRADLERYTQAELTTAAMTVWSAFAPHYTTP